MIQLVKNINSAVKQVMDEAIEELVKQLKIFPDLDPEALNDADPDEDEHSSDSSSKVKKSRSVSKEAKTSGVSSTEDPMTRELKLRVEQLERQIEGLKSQIPLTGSGDGAKQGGMARRNVEVKAPLPGKARNQSPTAQGDTVKHQSPAAATLQQKLQQKRLQQKLKSTENSPDRNTSVESDESI